MVIKIIFSRKTETLDGVIVVSKETLTMKNTFVEWLILKKTYLSRILWRNTVENTDRHQSDAFFRIYNVVTTRKPLSWVREYLLIWKNLRKHFERLFWDNTFQNSWMIWLVRSENTFQQNTSRCFVSCCCCFYFYQINCPRSIHHSPSARSRWLDIGRVLFLRF